MTKYKLRTPLPAENMPLWRLIGLWFISQGSFAALLAIFPYYHPVALTLGIILAATGLIAAIYAVRARDWRALVVFQNTWPLLIFAIGARGLISHLPNGWIWISLLLACYILTWLIPVLDPKLSALLWKEQTAPETRIGKGCMRIFIRFSPILMALGPILGIYGSRYGYDDIVHLAAGTILTLSAIGAGQVISHQIWPKRPWAQQEEPETEGH